MYKVFAQILLVYVLQVCSDKIFPIFILLIFSDNTVEIRKLSEISLNFNYSFFLLFSLNN